MNTYYGHPRLDCPNHAAPAPDTLTTTTEDGWIVTAIDAAPAPGERGWWMVDGETLVDVLRRIIDPADGRDGDAFGWGAGWIGTGPRATGDRDVTIVVQRHEDMDTE